MIKSQDNTGDTLNQRRKRSTKHAAVAFFNRCGFSLGLVLGLVSVFYNLLYTLLKFSTIRWCICYKFSIFVFVLLIDIFLLVQDDSISSDHLMAAGQCRVRARHVSRRVDATFRYSSATFGVTLVRNVSSREPVQRRGRAIETRAGG